jgi:hypothetical protein
MPAAEVAAIAAISKTRHLAKPGGDNSVSLYRHNLLTATFYGANTGIAGWLHSHNINYFKYLNPSLKN